MNQEFPVNFYELLEVEPSANQGEIKKAFRRLSKMHHPDLSRQEAGEKQQLLNQAMAVLSHPQQRRKHDAYWGQQKKSAAATLPEEFSRLVKVFRDRLRKAIALRETRLRDSREELAREILARMKRESRIPRLWPVIFLSLMTVNIILGILYHPAFAGMLVITPFFIVSLKRGTRGKMSLFQNPGNSSAMQAKAGIMAEARIEREISRLESSSENMDLLLAIFRRCFLKQEPRDTMVKICLGFLLLGFEPVKFIQSRNFLYFTNHQSSLLVKVEHPQSPEQPARMFQALNKQMVEDKIIEGHIFLLGSPPGELQAKAKPRGITLHDQRQSTLWLMEIARDLPSEPGDNFLGNLRDMTVFVKKLYR
ncbi:MAG: J domain-containing protein [Spirochaetales bacterium]|nr:J domain-containing protein [Spirochaetales bacterium]